MAPWQGWRSSLAATVVLLLLAVAFVVRTYGDRAFSNSGKIRARTAVT